MEDIVFERDGLHVRLDSTASHLSGACHVLTTACKRLEQYLGRSAASNMQLELLLASFVHRLVERVTCLLSHKVPAHRARLRDVVTLSTDSLELELRSIVELLHAVELGVSV